MSARGARSRKAVEKNIEKQEKKAAVKQKAPVQTIRKPGDAFGSNIHPSRQITVSSDVSRATSSRTSSTNGSNARPLFVSASSQDSHDYRRNGRPPTSTSGSTSVSDGGSGKGNDKNKYTAKGNKETKAPRGRGGGVPLKKPAEPLQPPLLRAETSLAFTPTNQKTWMNFRIWDGSVQGVKPYGGFDFDEHMQTGTVLIYFKEEQVNEDRPVPQLRAEYEILENSGSTWINNALLYGRLEDADMDDEEWMYEARRQSSLSPQSVSPNFPRPSGQRMLAPTSPSGLSSPPSLHIDQQYWGVPGNGTASRAQYYSESNASDGQSSQRASQIQPTHELWFTAPEGLKTPHAQRMHFVAVRNFLAILHGKPLVGADMFDMLTTLQAEIQVMYDLDHDTHTRTSSSERSVQMIINYIIKYQLDDVRQSIKQAMCLLAWAEQDNVRWKQGYLECFVHLTGVMVPQLEEVPEFKRLSLVTRRNLGIAAKQLQLRIMEAEEKLGPFDFDDIWFDPAKSGNHAVFQSYQTFKQFLINYYTGTYGNWPPMQGKSWLNRKIALDLQNDFGALYDYLVNRDVVWDSREERPGKKWQMANPKSEDFRADRPDLSVTDMIVTYDSKHGYLHIPHPYALLPRDIPQTKSKPAPVQKKGLFGMKKAKPEATKDPKAHLQLSIIYSDATNIEKLDDSFKGSPLIDAFETFELSNPLRPNTTPREARLGCWLLLYPILQYLSTLSVDSLTLKHATGVRYFLNADLKRLPEWVTTGQALVESIEDAQRRSWCWNRSWSPEKGHVKSGQPAELDGEGVDRAQEFGSGGGEMQRSVDGVYTHPQMPMQMQSLSPIHGGHAGNMDGGSFDPTARRDSRPQVLNPSAFHQPPPSTQQQQQQQQQLPQYSSTSTIQNDIQRIGEKIDSFSLSQPQPHHQQQRYYNSSRAPNPTLEKLKTTHEDFPYPPQHQALSRMDSSYRLTASDYASPTSVPPSPSEQYPSPPPPFSSTPSSPPQNPSSEDQTRARDETEDSETAPPTPRLPSRNPLRPPSISYMSSPRGGVYDRFNEIAPTSHPPPSLTSSTPTPHNDTAKFDNPPRFPPRHTSRFGPGSPHGAFGVGAADFMDPFPLPSAYHPFHAHTHHALSSDPRSTPHTSTTSTSSSSSTAPQSLINSASLGNLAGSFVPGALLGRARSVRSNSSSTSSAGGGGGGGGRRAGSGGSYYEVWIEGGPGSGAGGGGKRRK
ncbi:unnamed protein product [Periconia digitata]|uniref:DUF8004 domain-containing protein n=1 Tax=Periconia digitata TaxID=1303443 RepID=A0A9W4XTB6_9PLEO|nr:unnamed protein product [Periconia digitata]